MRDGSGSTRARDRREKDFGGETNGVCNVGEYPQGETPLVFCSHDQAHDSGQVHRGVSRSMETLDNSILGANKGEDSTKTSMELERYWG